MKSIAQVCIVCIVCLACLTVLATLPAQGATYRVDHAGSGDYLTIQEGINAASEGDTVLVAPGTYAGALNRALNFAGTNMVLMSEGGPDATTIDCEELSRCISFQSGEGPSSWFFGFTVTNGLDFYGGAIRCVGSSPTIANCVFSENTANLSGGAMLMVANSSPIVTNCVFNENSAHDLSGSGGGAVYCEQSAPVFTSCTFTGNSADLNGGAVCTFFAQPLFDTCTFIGNSAVNLGGAIMAGANATPTLDACTLVENVAFDGAVMFASQAPGLVTNTVMALNEGGGTVTCTGPTPEITHCCVSGNAGGDSLSGNYHDNLFDDPLFCRPVQRDYGLHSDSPCLPDYNPWGEQIGATGSGGCGTGIDGGSDEVASGALVLYAPAPNPFSGSTTVSCALPRGTDGLEVTIYSASGRCVRTLTGSGDWNGVHQVVWDGRDERGEKVASGVYFVRAVSGMETADGKLLLIK
ncbi:MAG: FlgD immunoglobulin-like domain containing protein [Candidatus Eisenbacteria bacterium]